VCATVLSEPQGTPRPLPPLWWALTQREIEVLQLLAEGLRNAEIATGLWVTEIALGKVLQKLNAARRAYAVAVGLRAELIS
jgi:DNA-binding CsgD family transcriptional regulator